MEIYFNKKTELYYVFEDPICHSCNLVINEGGLCKVVKKDNKFIKKFYCTNENCISEYKKIENSGQFMFAFCIGTKEDYDQGTWTGVYNFNTFLSTGRMTQSGIIKKSFQMASKPSTFTKDNTLLANKTTSLEGAQIGKDITEELEHKDKDVLGDDAVNEFFDNIKNHKPVIGHQDKKLLEDKK